MADRGEEILGTIVDGRYRVEAVLGEGHAGGSVFRGRDATAGSTVVVRCPGIPEQLEGEALDRALETFVAEAAMLATIGRGSNDVERLLASGIAERGEGSRVPYTVFEWLAGRSLERHVAERGGSSISEALVILEPAARALSLAHSMGTAHRDVRPANLWLAELDGRTTLKVAAFGLASRLGPGEAIFAPEYGAPEHFKKSYGAIGPATDVYGLALCLIEMVTGKRALDGADAGELYLAASDLAKRPTLRAHGSHVSDAVESVLQRALAVDPKRRWPTAREFWDALVNAVPEMTPGPPSVRTVRSDRPPGLAGAIHPGMTRQDSGPASDSMRAAAVKRPTTSIERHRADRSGLLAWAAVAVIGLIVVAVVVVKVGSGTAMSARGVADAGAAPIVPPSAVTTTTVATAAEPAVTVRPFLADMVRVPAGTFVMGSDHDGKGEKPPHAVSLTRAFYIDRTEVRAEAYAACVEDGTCRPRSVHAGDVVESVWGCNTAKERPKHPANCVDREQAGKYCASVRKRLPTEAEWEYAARGTDGREYPSGNTAPTKCTVAILSGVTGDCGDRKGTWEVGTAADGKSAFGAFDMAGNVWEWVADGWEAYPTADAGGPFADPKAALIPAGKGVLRGGSWDSAVSRAKATYRLPFAAASGNASTGLRCARDAE